VAVYTSGLVGAVYSNRSNIKVKSSAAITIALVSSTFYGIIKALASGVISPNCRFLINRLRCFASIKQPEGSN
jgi:hypothetical protein